MTDRRFLRANSRVASSALKGQVDAPRYTDGTEQAIAVPLTDLCASPKGSRDKQLLFGQAFTVLDDVEGWAFGFDPDDGYAGYVPSKAVGPAQKPTHRVCARLAHIYEAPDMKSQEAACLSFFSALSLTPETPDFFALESGGYIHRQHVQPINTRSEDAADTATRFLGTPYLWGGNSAMGIDCSGLVQLALAAAGLSCPRDSDLQHAHFDPIPAEEKQRGDLIFWKGHVGMLLDPDTLLHANAHHMATAIEPLKTAVTRIAQKEFGDVLGYARPTRAQGT